jgi:hypothetical protein
MTGLQYGASVSGSPMTPPPPTQAAVYNALHRGKDALGPAREVAAALTRTLPGLPQAVEANQAFVRRAVRHLAEAGIYQFVDLGAGMPVEPHLHTVVPRARFVYVDSDPTVCVHLRALCRADGVAVVERDFCDVDAGVDAVLDDRHLCEVLDARVPTAVILGAVLHYLTDDEATSLLRALRARLPAGSPLVVSLLSSDGLPPGLVGEAVQIYRRVSHLVLRTRQEILALLDRRALLSPGLVRAPEWRADPGPTPPTVGAPHLYAAVAVPRSGR